MESVTLAKIAGTYINMQDAFATEKATLGSWLEIGYSGPGDKKSASSYQSQVFYYFGDDPAGSNTEADAWIAQPVSKLGDCPTTGQWKIQATYLSSGTNEGSVKYTTSGSGTGNENCLALTPSFSKLSNTIATN